MGMISHLSANGTQTFAALVLELEAEFGSSETAGLAAHYLDAEAADFHWEARQMERHLGAYESLDETRDDLESICIIGFLNERWFVATCIVDGDGAVQNMIRLRHFTSAWDADQAFNGDG
jgi:hypothetical protein